MDLILFRPQFDRMHIGLAKRFEYHLSTNWYSCIPIQHVHNLRACDIFHASEL